MKIFTHKKFILRFLLFLILFIFHGFLFGQTGDENYIPDVSPVPPNAMEFLKYGEIPVSHYTGVPNITIPIYTIKEGKLEISAKLKYHAGGIRVKEEAGWIGLGWSMNFGNITQIINDRDDFAGFEKKIPDYYDSPQYYGIDFTYRYQYPGVIPNPCPQTNGIVNSQGFSYLIFTDHYYPINGNWIGMKDPELLNGIGTNPPNTIDSEPDVFKAIFFGHELEFMFEFGTENIIVLNNSGYRILKDEANDEQQGWCIVVPDGTKYYFNQVDVTMLYETVYDTYSSGYSLIDDRVENRTWYITKIETIENREIFFEYYKTGEIENLPTFSQSWYDKKKVAETETDAVNLIGQLLKFKDVVQNGGNNPNEPYEDHQRKFDLINLTKQTYSYLTSINFSNGRLDFHINDDRKDFEGTCKLDSISLIHYDEVYKVFKFNYGYFESNTPYNGYAMHGNGYFADKTEDELKCRLKLESFREDSKPLYVFMYDDIQLPEKTSFSTDYWGFYNGVENSSFLPNPERFDIDTYNSGPSTNHSAQLIFTKAGTLKKIFYPTGGYTEFLYDLHWFNNYVVPDFDSLDNVFSKGMGLRIRSITDFDGNSTITKTFDYKGGMASTKLKIFIEDISYNRAQETTEGHWVFRQYVANHARSNNYFISSLFGSGNFVGYDEVIIKTVGEDSNNGKRVLNFYNIPDIYSTEGNHVINLPSLKKINHPENGMIFIEKIKDENDVLLKENVYYYHYKLSDIYYGIKTGHVGFLFFITYNSGWGFTEDFKEQNIAGYYPIFSGKSLLDSVCEKSFFDNSTIEKVNTFTYNDLNLRKTDQTTNSQGESELIEYYYPSDFPDNWAMTKLVYENRLVDKIVVNKKNNDTIIFESKMDYFEDDDGLVLPYKYRESFNNGPFELKVCYTDYDNKGNLLEFYKNDFNYRTSYYWAYNKNYPVIKAENVAFDELKSAVENLEPDMDDFLINTIDDLSNENQRVEWTQFNNSLRNDLNNSLITSYSFLPFGISSQANTNSKTVFYQYDQFERLESILDNDFYLLNYYDYKYSDYLLISSQNYFLSPQAGSININIYTNLKWTASTDDNWITILPPLSGNGMGSITCNYDKNIGFNSRTGSILLSHDDHSYQQTILIEQLSEIPILSADPTELSFGFNGSTETVEISSNINWNVIESIDWISVNPDTGQGNDVISVGCDLNNTGEDRSGNIMIQGANVSVTINVFQNGHDTRND